MNSWSETCLQGGTGLLYDGQRRCDEGAFIYLFIGYTGANKHVKDSSVTQM